MAKSTTMKQEHSIWFFGKGIFYLPTPKNGGSGAIAPFSPVAKKI
jgi:hypothetical protein